MTRIARPTLGVMTLAFILATWWVLTSDSTDPFWPSLYSILETVQDEWIFSGVSRDLVPSLQRLFIGFAIGSTAGVTIGTVLGMVPFLQRALSPLLEFSRSLPGVTLIPAAFFLFGTAMWSKVAVVAYVTFWPVMMNTIDGVRRSDSALRDLVRVYKLSRRDRVLRVILPSASPQIFAGLRVAVAFSLLALVVAEMLISSSGLGYYIAVAQTRLQIRNMWSGILVIMVLAYVMNALFLMLERRALAWHRGARASALGESVERRRPARVPTRHHAAKR